MVINDGCLYHKQALLSIFGNRTLFSHSLEPGKRNKGYFQDSFLVTISELLIVNIVALLGPVHN
jgi:hypothetical protein